MAADIATGTFLVLVTWTFLLTAVVVLGLGPAMLLGGGRWTPRTPRAAIWWGLLVATTLVVLVNLALPLRSSAAGLLVLVSIVVLGGPGTMWALRARRSRLRRTRPRRPWWWLLAAAAGISVAYLAAAALGPVTNYDTGLYHLGAIAYAGDYATVPGLANLYFPFGYANAEFPLAAILGNGPWDGVGYRLLNGLLMAFVAAELLIRGRRGRLSAGFYVLAVGFAATWIPMIALSDYWVTSPTSDSAVLALTIVAVAYLADSVSADAGWRVNAGTAVAVSILMVMLRPTMAVFALAVIAVVVLRGWRSRARVLGAGSGAAAMLIGTAGVLAALAVSLRDYVLSGWLQFPLSVVAFDVAWLAPDPTDPRTATLGAARDPLDLWNAAEGWGWIGAWLGRLPSQWESFQFALLAIVALVLVAVAARRLGSGLRVKALLLAVFPSALAVAFWWAFTPPSFRFAWGPVFTLAAVPIGWVLHALASDPTAARPRRAVWTWLVASGVAMPVLAVTVFSAVARFDAAQITEPRSWDLGVQIPYAVAPITAVPVVATTTGGGVPMLVPTESDQCWDNYPLCSPQYPQSLRFRGEGIQQGFLR